ncbi:MAG: response regulator [Nitrincola lacisaponensis]|uniref:Chemotaxis regulator-transmits chemoreceptor signals to flagelllar motor components CheY n=1 Tax=Nitrincola lacisaponensis TaxID=267850 RepID=A0A063Y198_9GAMM|nr:response regulator [Nitrincola lacisaponensis]KDE38925.1 Chemotaxis regulator - transmits chemoreceptor signals to flagelllar motor components CheY [Nitrincola lacisaponensis]
MRSLSAAQLNLLLVEPSQLQRKIITQQLNAAGVMAIDGVDSVATAIESIRRIKPDLIVSALHFSDGTALDLLSWIRHTPGFTELPFMLVSSETRREQLETFRQSGVIAILPKPFTSQHLSSAIAATLDLLSADELSLEYYDTEKLRVLIVDDSRMARNLIRRVLTNLGIHHFAEAADGSEAISILSQEGFDLVVTDYNMPEVNGLQLTEHIRGHEELAHLPILMVTSESNQTHLSNVAQCGVNAMVDKPFEPTLVKRLLQRMLE